MNYLNLILAIIFEVSGAYSLKYTQGLTKVIPTILMFIFFTLSVTFLTLAVKKMEVGVGYAIWTGSGTALIAILGIAYFGEEASLIKIISLLLIIAGVVGLNLSGLKH